MNHANYVPRYYLDPRMPQPADAILKGRLEVVLKAKEGSTVGPFTPLRFGLGTWCRICAGQRRIVCYPLAHAHVLARRA